MNKKIKNYIIIFITIVFLLIFFQIIRKIILTSGKPKEILFEVGIEKLALKEISEIIKFEGIAEGDPQIKVYPSVPGKFEKNIVNEGDSVKKDAHLLYINRDIIGFEYNLAPVKSPIDGIVVKLYFFDKGDTVLPQMPVAEVAKVDKIKVVINTGEKELIKIKKGQSALIFLVYDNNIYLKGSVFSVTPFINKDTLSGTVVVKADNIENKIKPGQSVKVEIETEKRKAFLIPDKAVMTDERGTFIFINDNGIARKIYITTGYIENDFIEIIGDLSEGMEVITEGGFKLYENAKIKILN